MNDEKRRGAARCLHRGLSAIARFWPQLTLLGLAVIAYLSLSPLDRLPDAPGGDKLHHLVAYALLALPACLAQPRALPALLALFLFWGGAIELIQPFVNRYGEWADFLANAAGVGLGFALSLPLRSLTARGARRAA